MDLFNFDWNSFFGSNNKRGRSSTANIPTTTAPKKVAGAEFILTMPAEYRFDYTNYDIVGRAIGSGSFGCVFRLKNKYHGIEYALKIEYVDSVYDFNNVDREIGTNLVLSTNGGIQPFIVPVFGAQVLQTLPKQFKDVMAGKCNEKLDEWSRATPGKGVYVLTWMEFVKMGNIYKTTERGDVTSQQLKSFLFGMLWYAQGASQSFGLVHNDLSGGNILTGILENYSYFELDNGDDDEDNVTFMLGIDSLVPKVIDLGFAYTVINKEVRQNHFMGTTVYQPPESLTSFLQHDGEESDENRSVAADVWAIGLNAIGLITGTHVYDIDNYAWEHAIVDDVVSRTRKATSLAPVAYYKEVALWLLNWTEYILLRDDYIDYAKDEDHMMNWLDYAEQNEEEIFNNIRGQGSSFAKNYIAELNDVLAAPQSDFWGDVDTSYMITEKPLLYDILSTILSWNPSERDSTRNGLTNLLMHPYFDSLQIRNISDIPEDSDTHIITTEPSLYNQSSMNQLDRINDMRGTGFKVDKRCAIGDKCNVSVSTNFCGCCLRFYCSQEHADMHTHK